MHLWAIILIAIVAVMTIIVVTVIYVREQDRKKLEYMLDAFEDNELNFRFQDNSRFNRTLNRIKWILERKRQQDEQESWTKLIRVLTHEIMNATAPIQAVSQAYLQSPQIKGSPYEEGIRAIYDTSRGLAAFVESYRKLTCFQEPQLGDVSLLPFCQSVAALYPHLAWHVEVSPDATLRADAAMLRQVLINLVKNAAEAGAATIDLRWDGRLYVSNDGHAIPDDVAREIFVPFFTTKTAGSGIGLSMSRQMLVRQGLSLMLRERPLSGYNVTFVIESET